MISGGIRETPAPIPQAVLEAARLRLKRQVAALVIEAMAEDGVSFAEMDAKLGQKTGYSRRWLIRMIDGKAKDMDLVSDLCLAFGCEPHITLRSVGEPQNLADANSNLKGTNHDEG